MVFHWSLSGTKSPQVSRTRLSILAVLSNAVVWIVSTRSPTSKSSRTFNNPLVTVPNAPITIGTIVIIVIIIIIIIRMLENKKLNYIWQWDSIYGDLVNVEYIFIAITPRCTLTWNGNTS